ncbi:MAG: molybdenum cofactor guanylyltransferase [Candidatus Phaeomarinobacter sp.]
MALNNPIHRFTMMTGVAGVILAGGASRRFGADKAAALLDGRPMIAHVATRISPQVDAIAIAGAQKAYGLPYPVLGDGAYHAKGPLAGLLAGLRWAAAEGYSHAATVPCDVPQLPLNLLALLTQPATNNPVVLQSEHGTEAACALWPVALAPKVTDRLDEGQSLSMTGMLEASNAHVVPVSPERLDGSFANVNTTEDLAALQT